MLTIRLVFSVTSYQTMNWLNTDGNDDTKTRSYVSLSFVIIVCAETTFDNGEICFMTSALNLLNIR